MEPNKIKSCKNYEYKAHIKLKYRTYVIKQHLSAFNNVSSNLAHETSF